MIPKVVNINQASKIKERKKYEPLNIKRALELFEREAILIGRHDVVPLNRAVELFGEEAVAFAKGQCKSGDCNCYGIGKNGSLDYFRRDGFCIAVTYANIEAVLNGKAVGCQ